MLLRIRAWWETADRTQKVVTIFGGAFLAVLLYGTYSFASRPKMALAYGGLAPAELGKVVAEIQKLGVDVEYDLQGNIRVPSNRVAEVQAMLARSGAAPVTGHPGNEGLSGISMTTPKSVEAAQLVAIREGEIAKTIEGVGGVDSARVLINPGQRGSFASEDEPPTASVMVTVRPGAEFGAEQAKGVAALVAKGVPGLTTRNVSVINQDGATLFDGTEQEGSLGPFSTPGEAQAHEGRRVKRELQPLLDRAFGAGNTLVTVRVEMDFDKTDQRTEQVLPKDTPIRSTTASEKMDSGGAGGGVPSGLAGAAGAIAPPAGTTTGGKQTYTGEKDDSVFPYDTIQTQTQKARGATTGMAISVLADSKAIKDARRVQTFLEGFLGPKFKNRDPNYTVTVTSTEFDRTGEKVAKDAAAAAAGSERMQQIFSLVPIVALIGVAFFVMKALAKAAKSQNVLVQALPDGRLAAASGGFAAPAPVRGGGHELTEAQMRAFEASNEAPPDVGAIADRLNVPLEQIKRMATDKPHIVGMLLKSWILEDRR